MKTLGNLIWLICGGLLSAIEYLLASLLMMITIVGIPFGLQTLKLAGLMLWPFGRRVVDHGGSSGCLSVIMNILWLFLGGLGICLTHLFFGILLCLTLIGIPFGKQHFKLAGLALTPFGKHVV
ncbi:YccF domain-containing protein [Tannerella sp.]|uniref:YccF domain-containing protein n=1 Tax=Tannerella sp. TaxID=2382127 RepID=UPI003FA24888